MHPGLGDFLARLNDAGWYDAFFDEGAEERRVEALTRAGYGKRIVDRVARRGAVR